MSSRGMSIQDRIRAMNETLDQVEAAPEGKEIALEERTIVSTTLESPSAVQQSALHTVENVSSPSSRRSSVVDMWRQREGPKTRSASSPVIAERPQVVAGVRQVVVAPPFVQKRRSLVTSPDDGTIPPPSEIKKDPETNDSQKESRHPPAPVDNSWQPKQSLVSQSLGSVPKGPLWVSSPPKVKEDPKEAFVSPGGGRNSLIPSFKNNNNAAGPVSPRDNIAQLLKPRLPAATPNDSSQSPGSLASPKKQDAKRLATFKDHVPVDLTIVPSTNDLEADTRSTPGSRRSRVSDLVAVVQKHEQAEGSPLPDIHLPKKAASPSTESPGTRRSSVVDFWKTRTTTAAVTERPPIPANAPRKAAASLQDVLEKRKEKETPVDGADEHESNPSPKANTAQEKKTNEAENETGTTTSVADRWNSNTGNRSVGKQQDRSSGGPASVVPRTSTATLANSLRNVFEKRNEEDTRSDGTVEHDNQHNNNVTSKLQQRGVDAKSETGGTTSSIANRWGANGGNRFVGKQQTRPTVERAPVEASLTTASHSHDEDPDETDTASPHAISFKEKARLFEQKSSQSRPGSSGPKKATNVGDAFKKSLGGQAGPVPPMKTVTNRWNPNVVGKSSVHMNKNDSISSDTVTQGMGRLPQIPPMHPKKGFPMEGSPKSLLSSQKCASHDPAMKTEEGAFSTNWQNDLSGPEMSSSLDPSLSSHHSPQLLANDNVSQPEDSIGGTSVPEKGSRGTATPARSASSGSFGELLPDSVANPTPSLKRHARIPSAGSIGELGARYRVSSVGSIGDVKPPTSASNDSTLPQNQGGTKSKDWSNRKNALSSRIVQSLLNETKTSQSPGPKPNETAVLPKPLRFQKPNQEGAGGKDQSRNGDALLSSKESAFDSWPSKSEDGNEQDAQPGSARKRNRRNLASLGKRHIAKTSAQKNTHGDAYSVVSNPSSSMFSSQRSTQSQNKGTESAVKPMKVVTSDWSDNAWPSEGLDQMFSLSVDSGSIGQTEIPDEIVTKKFQDQHEKKFEGSRTNKKPSSTKSISSGKFSMTDGLDPIDEYQWSQTAVNHSSQAFPQPSEYTALDVSVSEPKWQSASDLSFGMKPSLHSPAFEDNKSDFSVFSDSVSKASSTSSLANKAERALQARRRKNRTYVTTGTVSNMAPQVAHSAADPTQVRHSTVDHSRQQHSAQSGSQLHALNHESNVEQFGVGYRYDESYAQSLSEKRRAAGLMTTYKTSSRFMEEADELEPPSAPPPARKSVADEVSVESGESSYRTLETATSESESPWSKGHSKRRSVVGPVPEKFIDESAENMDNFQKAFESLGLSQIASDLAREVRLATLDISNLAKGMNETVKTFRTPAYTRRKAMVPKDDAPFDEDVAIEVEYLEDYTDDDESAMVNASIDDFAIYDEQPFDQPPSDGRGTKSAYV